MSTETCPACNTSMQGDPIPAEHQRHKPDHDEQVERYGRCFCRSWGDSTHFSRVIGVEVSEAYDGVLYWLCPDCAHAWPRFTEGRLASTSAKYADERNQSRGAA